MGFLIDFIKGIFVGVANVIPGVSGGTMAVSFGIYDKLISSVTGLLKKFKESFKTLLPIVLGMAFGVIAFTFIIPVILKHQPFITATAFTGLIIGGLPALVATLKEKKKLKPSPLPLNLLIFMIMFAISAIMPFMGGDKESGSLLSPTPATMVIVFFMGVIAAASMVIPGVSGSLMLMILGYYFGIITCLRDFISALKDFDMAVMVDRGLVLAPFALGCIIGIFFIAKIIEWLLSKHPVATYWGILGLVVSSPISIYYKVNQEFPLAGTSTLMIVLGVLIGIICMGLTYYIGNLDVKTPDEPAEVASKKEA